jgi:proteic killer suppression protein
VILIKSFRDRNAQRLFERNPGRKPPVSVHRTALRKLLLLDAAERLSDLRVPPGNRLERLRGDRNGQHSIRINDRWRICFRWRDGDAYDVEIVDYH